jgi:aminomethyltransferase
MAADAPRKRTPLHDAHVALGARIIDFGGWDMPVSYKAGTIKEHKAVREALGLFDVSHMGEAVLRGARATEAVQRLTTNDVGGAAVGKAVYTLLCRPDGGIVDDCIFYKRSDTEYFVIVNASGVDARADRRHGRRPRRPERRDRADRGPGPEGDRDRVDADVGADRRDGQLHVLRRRDRRREDAVRAHRLHRRGRRRARVRQRRRAQAVGRAARGRRAARRPAKLPLYGNDLDDTTSPLEAGLGWAVKLGKGDFLGRGALVAQKEQGLKRQLVGFKIEDRAIARHGYAVVDRNRDGDQTIGVVTSGGPGISVTGSIGLAYVPPALAAPGTNLTIDCRGKDVAATVVKGKFYTRPTHA